MYSNDTRPSTPLGAGSVLGGGVVGDPALREGLDRQADAVLADLLDRIALAVGVGQAGDMDRLDLGAGAGRQDACPDARHVPDAAAGETVERNQKCAGVRLCMSAFKAG